MDLKRAIVTAGLCGAGIITAMPTQAAVVGYWRLENGSVTADSSGNGLTLTENGDVTEVSGLVNPVPQTGATNTGAASGFSSVDSLSRADEAALDVTDFTIEAFIRSTDVSNGNRTIASKFQTTGNQRSWQLITAGDTLRLAVSPDGTFASGVSFNAFTLATDTLYYVAASFDTGPGGSTVNLYLKDMSDPNATLQVSTQTNNALTTLFDSNHEFRIGQAGNGNPWSGTIDEVRLSNTVLSESDLLVVPEPASMALLGLGGLCLIGRRRA